jgi:hypothetical protein
MKHKILIASLIFTLSFTLMGFINSRCKIAINECKIMIGIGYKQTKCNGDNGLSVSEAIDYFGTANSFSNYGEMKNTIRATLLQFNRINENDIIFSSSSKPYAVVISYAKRISGWNCTIKRMAVGFGNSLAEAEEDAEIKKNNDANRSVSYRVIKIFSCG